MGKPLSVASISTAVYGSFRKKKDGTALRGGKRNEVRPGTLHALHQPRVVGLKLLDFLFFFRALLFP